MLLREVFAEALREQGKTQDQLAAATGILKGNLSRMLSGKKPICVWHLLLIQAALGLTLDYRNAEIPKK